MEDDLTEKKKKFVKELVSEGYLNKKEVIDAFIDVPREEFVPKEYRAYAYINEPVSIGSGQTISQPLTVAVMTEVLDVKKGMKVLEIGTGSGYQAAILSRIVGNNGIVISVERIGELAEFARNNLMKCNCSNVVVIEGDGSLGYEKQAPYDRIIVTASSPSIPEKLVEQLKINIQQAGYDKNGSCLSGKSHDKNGKMVIPVGDEMFLIIKITESKIKKEFLGYFAFVPLIGKFGHKKY
ncbi:MAG: protein-L-isoaspartate(D-aspartate) O-methyltransferase [Candidatus Aenigmarchaeota archaeon]|nr:protein-L-isoaspartate(D-aspartate) O-methyltransferase [Candidatus Aenigmarchaeota archaeon]